MTVKVRDSAGALRTVDVVKVRGPDGTVRIVDFIKVRGSDGTLRTVYEKAGGGGGGTNPAYITPGSRHTSSLTAADTAYFGAQSSAETPSAYAWGLLDGTGNVVSGATSQTAQLRVVSPTQNEEGSATFYCDMTIGGTVYRAIVTSTHYWQTKGGPDQVV
ncbi:hypothetical protein ACWGNZ_07035 [Sphingomonas zeae]